jgi:hypothetical protein
MSKLPRTAEIGGVVLHLSAPDTTELGWIGLDAILRQLLQAVAGAKQAGCRLPYRALPAFHRQNI